MTTTIHITKTFVFYRLLYLKFHVNSNNLFSTIIFMIKKWNYVCMELEIESKIIYVTRLLGTYIDCPIFSILVYKRYKRFHFQCIIYNGDSDLFQNHIQ